MILLKDIKLPINHSNTALQYRIIELLKLNTLDGFKADDLEFTIHKKSIDARKKPDIFYIYSVYVKLDKKQENNIKNLINKKRIRNASVENPVKYVLPECGNAKLNNRPVIVGFGPAGMFAAYLLAQKGFCPIVIERGQQVEERTKTVTKCFNEGVLNTESNVQFGEGGAGTFSDGKLNTLTRDTFGRNTYVLSTFHHFGAPYDITYNAKPHIGTDLLVDVVKNLRNEVIRLGGEVRFNNKLVDITITNNCLQSITIVNNINGAKEEIVTNNLILAIGHSARDTFEKLYDLGIDMSPKSFAVGFRVQHPQSYVNMWQYGVEDSKKLGLESADYKVTNEASNGRRVYSFCMCPGGYVVNASSEEGQIAVNGMSERKRDSGYANSAIIAAIDPDDFIQNEVSANHPLRGMYYQRRIEQIASTKGNGNICVQRFADFEQNISSSSINETTGVKGLIKPGNLRGIFASDIDEAIIESIHKFGYTRKGFDDSDTLLYGIESRTSSPIRIQRNEELMSNITGIYPCGEGAGYAGGITSAAADGIKVAEEIIKKYCPNYNLED